MAVREFVLKTKGMEMDCITFGRGSRPLVMLQGLNTHGIRGAGVSLALMYRIFAREYRVYLFDRRKELAQNITMEDLAMDAAAAMDALGIRNADLIGVSQGGMMAQVLAARRPDLVRKLVLAVTTGKSGETLKNTIARWVGLTERADWKNLVADMADRMYSAEYMRRYRPLLPLLTMLQKPKDVQRFLTLAKTCADFDAEALLEEIRCPVYVIGGKRDLVLGEGACEALARKLGCECHLYEELGHAAYEEAKDFNQRIYAFLKE